MSREIYTMMIQNCISNSDKQLTLKEIVDKTGIPKATAFRILKTIGYEYNIERKAWNKGLTKEDNDSIKEMAIKKQQTTGWKHKKKTREKISRSLKKKGTIPLGLGGGITYDYGDDIVNSDYELQIAQLLDEEGILWNNKNSVKHYTDNNKVTRMMYLGLYLPEYNVYISVKYHIKGETRKKIRLIEQQNNIKVIIIDQMLFRRIVFNNIKKVLENSLQNK